MASRQAAGGAVAPPTLSGVAATAEGDLTRHLLALHAADDLDSTLLATVSSGMRLAGATRAVLFLADGAGSELEMSASCDRRGAGVVAKRGLRLDPSTVQSLLHADQLIIRPGEPVADHLEPILLSESSGGRPYPQVVIPMREGDRLLGMLLLAFPHPGPADLSQCRPLALLLEHAVVAIRKARTLHDLRHQVDGLSAREDLQRTLAIHDELTQMVLDGQGIQAIVGILGRLLANPVSVEDRYQNLVGYYPSDDYGDIDEGRRLSILHGGTPQEMRDDPALQAVFTRLRQERRPVRLPPIPRLGLDKPRVFAPVVVGRETLAYVCVLESHRRLDDLDLMTLERAAVAIALQVMKEKAAAEERYKLRGDFVAELLADSYGAHEVMLNRAAYLGIDLHVPRAVLVLDVDDFAGFASRRRAEDKILALKANLLEVIERTCRQAAPDSVVSAKSDEIIVLAKVRPAGTGDHGTVLHQLGDLLRSEVRRWVNEVSVSVGIGSCCDTLADYARSYRQARRALDVIKASDQRDRTLAFDQLGIYGLLLDVCSRDKLVALVEDALAGLLQYDRRHATDLTETLDCYLRHNGHLEQTAAALNIHLNTLRYRLGRIGQITGAELHSFEARFNLQLALSVRRALNLR